MSRHGTLLPLPDDPWFPQMVEAWPIPQRWPYRATWLREFEVGLKLAYPESSSADRKLTARHYAPFPLALGPNVP